MSSNLKQVTKSLDEGKVVCFATDTVYGLAVDPFNANAIAALYTLKGRDHDKPLAILAADFDQIATLATAPDSARAIGVSLWPGALTLVLPLKEPRSLPKFFNPGFDTIGVRIPDHAFVLELLKAYGKPLAATSANLSGEPEYTSMDAIQNAFGEKVACYADSGDAPKSGVASTVADLTTDTITILRQGDVTLDQLEALIK